MGTERISLRQRHGRKRAELLLPQGLSMRAGEGSNPRSGLKQPPLFHACAGHDCSLRLWSLDNKTCVQEITAHRKKHEEAIHAVACHPSKALIASAGADALAKVFV